MFPFSVLTSKVNVIAIDDYSQEIEFKSCLYLKWKSHLLFIISTIIINNYAGIIFQTLESSHLKRQRRKGGRGISEKSLKAKKPTGGGESEANKSPRKKDGYREKPLRRTVVRLAEKRKRTLKGQRFAKGEVRQRRSGGQVFRKRATAN